MPTETMPEDMHVRTRPHAAAKPSDGDAEELVVADVDLAEVEAARAEMLLGGAGPHHAVAAALERLRVRSP